MATSNTVIMAGYKHWASREADMTALDGLLQAIVAEPQAEARWLILSDWLEENDDPRRAELLRLHRKMLATCCQPELHPERAIWQGRMVELLDQGVRPCCPQKTVVLAKGVEMTFSFIPPGTFLMGSPDAEEGRKSNETLHQVTFTRGFWLGVFPVTQAQWQTVMGSNPSKVTGDGHPVTHVFWDECQAFCRELSEMTAKSFHLPTEARWEYACRAGSTTAYYLGNGPNAMKQAGWCNHDGAWGTGQRFPPGYLHDGKGAEPKPVGLFAPNAWGLFDMHGNVWEWCQDWYERYHCPERDWIDPAGPNTGTMRVLRGGCFFNDVLQCRSAFRTGFEPDFIRTETVGFRVCLCQD
jgi:uncharacterized protein (TIGR02996 family)